MSLTEQMALQNDIQPMQRKGFKQKYQQCRKLLRQAANSKPKVQKLLEMAFEEELSSLPDWPQIERKNS